MPLAWGSVKAAESLFDQLFNRFQRTCYQSGACYRLIVELGGLRVQLNFAQPGLTHLAERLMGHLKLPPGSAPALRVYCWQGKHDSEGFKPVPNTQIIETLDPQSRLRCSQNGLLWERQLASGTEMLLDMTQHRALYRLSPGPSIAFVEQAALMRPLLVSWAGRRGLIPAHAAAVGTAGRGVLLAGGGGYGKTTTALRCLLQGMDFAGDDRVMVQTDPPRVWSLYGSAKISREAMDLLPELQRRVQFEASAPLEKGLLYLKPGWKNRTIRSFSLGALVLPQVREPWSGRLIPIAAGEALRALAPSTLLSQSQDDKNMFLQMAKLVRQIRAYRLGLGGAKLADTVAIPHLIEEVL